MAGQVTKLLTNPFENLLPLETHPLLPNGNVTIRSINRVRETLTEYRHAAGLTQSDVHDRFDWSMAKIHKIENGPSPIRYSDAMVMLILYGVTDETEKESVLKQIPRSKSASSLPYTDLVSPIAREYMECEADAGAVTIFQPDFVPDVMQTNAYAQALTAVFEPGQDANTTAGLADLRVGRAGYLLGRFGPTLNVVIDESVLHRAVGGETAPPEHKYDAISVVIDGLKYLNTAGRRLPEIGAESRLNPAISIQVVPFEHGAYPGMQHPYTIFDFPDSRDRPLVFVDTLSGDIQAQDTGKLSEYREMFQGLSEAIPGPENTNEILEGIQEQNLQRSSRITS